LRRLATGLERPRLVFGGRSSPVQYFGQVQTDSLPLAHPFLLAQVTLNPEVNGAVNVPVNKAFCAADQVFTLMVWGDYRDWK